MEAPQTNDNKPNIPDPKESKGKSYQTPGLRDARTTAGFRVINFELFAKPNKVVMIAGVVAFSSCVAYIAYWRANMENKKMYTTVGENEKMSTRVRTSRWD